MVFRASSLLLLIIFVCGAVRADSWMLPSKRKYCSADKKYCVEVIPKKLENQLAHFQAVAVRAEGKVVFEVVVSKTGELICARTLSGHPLLTANTLRAIKLWEFEPIDTSEGSSKVVSTFAINFKLR